MSTSRPVNCTVRNFARPMRDYWGVKMPRPIRIGKVGEALEALSYAVPTDRPFLLALESSFGAECAPIRRLAVELYQEGLSQWIFMVGLSVKGRNRRRCLTLAKNYGKFNRLALREWELLKALNARNSEQVVRVQGSCSISPVGARKDSALFGYFSEWLGENFTELGIDSRHRFFLVGQDRTQELAPVQDEAIRAQILEVLASVFDPSDGSALLDIQINSGDFMGRILPGAVEVKLIAARRLHTGLSGAGLLRNLFQAKGDHAGKPTYLIPKDVSLAAASLRTGLTAAFKDEDKAMRFLKRSIGSAMRKGSPLPAPFYTWELLKHQLGL